MSILSKIGNFIGTHLRFLMTKIAENKADLDHLKSETSNLQTEVLNLQTQIKLLQVTGSVHSNDINILDPEKGLVLQSEDYIRYRIRISKENKLIVDNVSTNENNVHELILLPSGSSGYPIGSINNDEET